MLPPVSRAVRPDGESAGQSPYPIAVATYDYGSGTWSWSPEMYTLIGVPDDGTDPETIVFSRMHPDDRDRVATLIAETIRSGGRLFGQYRLLDDRGARRSIAFAGDTERDPDGTPVRLRGIAFDITADVRGVADEAVRAATADRAAIEQAKGALMYAYRLDADAAFELLAQVSQRNNVRIAVLAAHVVRIVAEPVAPGEDTTMLEVLERATREAIGAIRPAEQGVDAAP